MPLQKRSSWETMSTFCKRRSCKDLEKDIYKGELIPPCQNIARVQKCPDITILYSLFGLCLFICSSFCPFFLFFCLFSCPFVFLPFYLFVFLFRNYSDQMSEGSWVSKVTLCVKILKWQSLTRWLTHWPRSGLKLPGQLKNVLSCYPFSWCDFLPVAFKKPFDHQKRLKIRNCTSQPICPVSTWGDPVTG